MWPAIEVREKDDSTARGPVKICFSLRAWWRAFKSKRTLPELFTFAGYCIGSPDRPGLGSLFKNWFRSATASRPSNKCDSLSIGATTVGLNRAM